MRVEPELDSCELPSGFLERGCGHPPLGVSRQGMPYLTGFLIKDLGSSTQHELVSNRRQESTR